MDAPPLVTLTAGACTACDGPTWRRAAHAKTGVVTILWPDPTTVYACVATVNGLAPGIGYHAGCAPALGGACGDLGEIVGYEPAVARYGVWFTEGYGVFLKAWLADHLQLGDIAIARAVAQWDEDRRGL